MAPSATIPGYQILDTLGRGGMAIVHRALQESLGREVALKLLLPALAADPAATERFLREGRIAARLAHRHIVGIHDVGVHEGQPYLAMEFIAGGPVPVSTAHAPRDALEIVRQVALALAHAHREGVIHRDIKPDNILRRSDGSYALADFGIARAAHADAGLTGEGLAIGTPHYMSPEQVQGLPLDGRSDLYSLGIVMYQLLTARLPYAGSRDVAVGVQHVYAPLPALPAPLAGLQPLLDHLLAKDPAKRLRDAALLARRVEALQAGWRQGASPTTPGPGENPAERATVASPLRTPAPEAGVATRATARASGPHGRAWIGFGLVLALIAAGAWWLATDRSPRVAVAADAAGEPVSIAVLPLVNASGDAAQQYFADGLSENLIVALSQFEGLRVISRNSAFRFRDTETDSRAIGAALGVAHLLEGSVQRAGETVRVTATLVRSADGTTLWSQRYDRPYQDLFALQDDITAAVAAALRGKLLARAATAPHDDRPPGGDLDAYAAYLEGRFHADRRTAADQRRAIDALARATRIDPAYAQAWATLSRAWTGLIALELEGDAARDAYAEARAAVETALALAPGLASAHAARGYLLANADYDWRGAEAEYRRAVELAPGDDYARHGLGRALASQGRVREALGLTRGILANDPLHATQHYWLSMYLGALGDLDEAAAAARRAIELQPEGATFHSQLTLVEVGRGDARAALEAARRAPAGVWKDVALAFAHAAGRDRAAADAALATLEQKHAQFAAYQVAEVHALRGDADRSLQWLERALANRDPGITLLLFDPALLRLRDDPRFAAFCAKVGLPAPRDSEARALRR